MTGLPSLPNTFFERLKVWNDLQQQLKQLKTAEILLRKDLFGEAFTTPKEGTNYIELNGGWRLKGVYKIERSVDTTYLDLMRAELAKLEVPLDPLLKWKCELNTTNYRLLQGPARTLFDNIVTAKDGAPSLEFVPPDPKDAPEEPAAPGEIPEPEKVETATVTLNKPAKKPAKPRKKKQAEE